MDQILDAPIDADKNLNYAGFWIRFGAYFIDGIILSITNAMFQLILAASLTSKEMLIVYLCLYFIAVSIYFAGMESSSKQATLGKMAVGIKVGDTNGERISFGNALGRLYSKIISGITLYIGFMMAGWDQKKQALHDKIANTYVFYDKK